MTTFRTEKDSLGKIKIPAHVYYGTTTARALNNFQISQERAPKVFKVSLGKLKLACCLTNFKLGLITEPQMLAIAQACQEFCEGHFDEYFQLDVYQAGAGTSYNMNANEVIANRANELLGYAKGSYKAIHPNDHVNMAQSTNDTFPTVTKIAILTRLPILLDSLKDVINELKNIAEKEKHTIKVGRTHMQDAVPITIGQEFLSYTDALEQSLETIADLAKPLTKVGIGGTATGTGLNSHPQYQETVIKELNTLTRLKLVKSNSNTASNNNFAPFSTFSAGLRSLATNLLNLSEDLKMMNSGPKAGLGEIELPAVQPGSSIMPGKTNPSILECLDMICMQVIGLDTTISVASQRSHFELNVHCPLIMYNTLTAMEILANGLIMLKNHCLVGIKFNHERIQKGYEASLCKGTALIPYLGYSLTTDIVRSAAKNQHTIDEEVLNRGLISEERLKQIFSESRLTSPSERLDLLENSEEEVQHKQTSTT